MNVYADNAIEYVYESYTCFMCKLHCVTHVYARLHALRPSGLHLVIHETLCIQGFTPRSICVYVRLHALMLSGLRSVIHETFCIQGFTPYSIWVES